MNNRNTLLLGAIFMGLVVLLGAFGAHALKNSLSPDMLSIYKTGVEYQFYHALGLLLIGSIGFQINSKWLSRSGILALCRLMWVSILSGLFLVCCFGWYYKPYFLWLPQ